MKWNNLNNFGKGAFILLTILVIGLLVGVIGLITGFGIILPLRIFFGSIYVLFLPGFILTFIFFPLHSPKGIDKIERIALSFALSIAVVPLIIFYLNLIGLKISALNSFLTILGIIILELAIIFYMKRKAKNQYKLY